MQKFLAPDVGIARDRIKEVSNRKLKNGWDTLLNVFIQIPIAEARFASAQTRSALGSLLGHNQELPQIEFIEPSEAA